MADQHVFNNACMSCAKGKTNGMDNNASGGNTECTATFCKADKYVLDNECMSCAKGTTSAGSADASGFNTGCMTTYCHVDEFIYDHYCSACPSGSTNKQGGDDASGDDTECAHTLCLEGERVKYNECVQCPPGTTHPGRHDATGGDTTCDEVTCDANEHVSSHECVQCPPGTANAANDEASGDDTSCEVTFCEADEYVSNNACISCAAGTHSGANSDATGIDTECEATLCKTNQYVLSNSCMDCRYDTTNTPGDNASGPDTHCEGIVCVTPQTITSTTKHGKSWSKNEAYIITEGDTLISHWDVTAVCAEGFAGDPVVEVCTEGLNSEYSISGCNIDSDSDGVPDDDESCPLNPEKQSSGICGCHMADYDPKTQAANCPTSKQIGIDSTNGPFYTQETVQWGGEDPGSYTSVRLDPHAWTEKGTYLVTDEIDRWSSAWSSAEGHGTLTSVSFVISHSTLAFQAGYGGRDLATIKLLTKAEDGTFTRARKEFKPLEDGIRQVLWDVSGLHNEIAVIVLEKQGPRLYVDNIHQFNSAPGCISDCMTIAPAENADLDIMGTTYGPVTQGTSFEDDTAALYCAVDTTGTLPAGTTPGGLFAGNFPTDIDDLNLAMDRLPNCMMVRKLPGENTYDIALETGMRRFAFKSSKPSVGSDSLHCVFQTQQPRCIDYSNVLAGVRQADMHCVESTASSTCTELVLSLKCPLSLDMACGAKKSQRDLLECCDKNNDKYDHSCLTLNRRLGSTVRFSADEVIDMDEATLCARSCYQYPDGDETACVAWRLDDISKECKLALKCYPASYEEVDSFGLSKYHWNMLDGAAPFEGKTVQTKVLKA